MSQPKVFISHRHEDAYLAAFMKTELHRIIGQDKITIFVSEDIEGGTDWRIGIEKALRQANHLILIYTDPSEDWSWCFYEVGFFQALIGTDDVKRKVYCLRRPDAPVPGPIGHTQQSNTVDKVADVIGGIVEQAVGHRDGERNKAVASAVLQRLASERFEGIKRVRIEFDDVTRIRDNELPLDGKLSAESSTINMVFGYARSSLLWSEIIEMARQTDASRQHFDFRWINEMVSVISDAKEGMIRQPQCVLFARTGELRYRFTFNHARQTAEGRFVCEFIVSEDVSGPARGMPASLLSLMTSIRMAVRLRYEIIERHKPLVDLSTERRSAHLHNARTTLFNVLAEAETRGSVEEQDLIQAFEEPEERTRIRSFIHRWPQISANLGIDAPTWIRSGSRLSDMLTAEAATPDVEEQELQRFADGMRMLKWSNRDFLDMACRRMSRMFELSAEEKRKALDVVPNEAEDED